MATVPNLSPIRKPVFIHAHFEGCYGTAIRASHGAAWFQGEDDSLTLLHDCDQVALELHGRCDLAREQAEADGPLYQWIEARNTEHARPVAG
jgi:hypothetical protein